MKVYAVMGWYDNGEKYEDNYFEKKLLKIFSTKEKALDYIANNNGECFGELWVTEEGFSDLVKRYSKEIDDAIREEYVNYGITCTLEEYKKEVLTQWGLRSFLSDILDLNVCIPVELPTSKESKTIRMLRNYPEKFGFYIIEQEVE